MVRVREPEQFVALCGKAGADAAYVQGGGGNASVKLDGCMAVKASGVCLKDVAGDCGYVVVRDAPLRTAALCGEIVPAEVMAGLGEAGMRPSMETGFHAVLGRYVLHTHNMYVNVLACAEEGRARLAEIWPEGIWLPYVTPGDPLTLAVAGAVREMNLELPQVIFLQNHGVIVSAATAEAAWDTHEALTERLLMALGMEREVMPADVAVPDLAWMRETVMFPDQIVFTLEENGLTHTQAAKETFWAYGWMRREMARLGLTPRGLAYTELGKVGALPTEKYRMTIAR